MSGMEWCRSAFTLCPAKKLVVLLHLQKASPHEKKKKALKNISRLSFYIIPPEFNEAEKKRKERKIKHIKKTII